MPNAYICGRLRRMKITPVMRQNISSCSVLSPEIVMHDDAYIGGRSENNIKCAMHDDLGWKNQTTRYILPRHWLYEWFSQFHSCGTYSVLSWSPSIYDLCLQSISWYLQLHLTCNNYDHGNISPITSMKNLNRTKPLSSKNPNQTRNLWFCPIFTTNPTVHCHYFLLVIFLALGYHLVNPRTSKHLSCFQGLSGL